MKFNVHYRTLYARLHPNSSHSIRCARFLYVWRPGMAVVHARGMRAAIEAFNGLPFKGKEREVIHVRRITPAMDYRPRRYG